MTHRTFHTKPRKGKNIPKGISSTYLCGSLGSTFRKADAGKLYPIVTAKKRKNPKNERIVERVWNSKNTNVRKT